MKTNNGWKTAAADLFWGDLAFHDHVLQVYENDEVFLETLAGFAATGIQIGDCCLVAVTSDHLVRLNQKLKKLGIDVDAAMADDRYIPIIAEEMIPRFMVQGEFQEQLFTDAMGLYFQRCRDCKRLIRASGEMVAILASQGNWNAAFQLERLWNKLHEEERFTIYCAYPKSALVNDNAPNASIICAEHSLMISGNEKQSFEVYYRDDVHIQ